MKTKFFYVCQATSLGLLLGLAWPTAGTAAARNLVRNPAFEEPLGPDNWTVVYDDCGPFDFLIAGRSTMANKDAVPGTWDADPPGSTNYLSKQGGHFAPNYCNGLMHGCFKQVVANLRPGAEYNCSAWMVQYTRNDNYLARSQVWMEVLGGPNLSVPRQTPYVMDNANNNPAGWKQYALTNTASQNGEIEIRLHYAFIRTIAQVWEYRNVNAFYDDVAVEAVNLPPLADASATVPLVISANSIDAQVVLDGSRSSDPDVDALYYLWYQAGALDPIATGMVAVVTLPVGTNALELAVDDGLATNRQAFTVEVITIVEALERLRAKVRAEVANPQPLVATLSAAVASVERCNLISAINQLQAFQNQVRAQVAPYDPALAQQLIRAAQEIIDLLDGGRRRPHRQFTRVERLDQGKVRIELAVESTARHVIEASTNLVDWELIGVASERIDGMFEFADPGAAGVPARFYRIRSLVPNDTP
jgi:hypothetical protein